MRETRELAKGLRSEKTYQQRAREALPLLVRQAEAGEKIYYADLAAEMGIEWPRTLNRPLGPSEDTVDELFLCDEAWYAAEVKPASFPDAELVRGMF